MMKNNPYTNYQLSTIGVGAIATGLDDVRQCIDFILRTIPGSDPLRPLFGCDIFQYVDKPVTTGIPNMKKAIFEALDLWEKRIIVKKITHEVDKANVKFNITYNLLDEDLIDTIAWTSSGIINTGSSVTGIILSAVIPIKLANGRYNVVFNVNGDAAYPSPPLVGFDSAADMLTWVTVNWSFFGKWYITNEKLVVYIFPGLIKTATLAVTQTAVLTIKADIPNLVPGQFYQVVFTADGTAPPASFPAGSINSVEGLINWVQNNWSAFGNFTIESNGVQLTEGDFNSDFNNDFDTGGLEILRKLVFQTEKHAAATLVVTAGSGYVNP